MDDCAQAASTRFYLALFHPIALAIRAAFYIVCHAPNALDRRKREKKPRSKDIKKCNHIATLATH